MNKQNKPILVVASSDHHTNSTLGLCPPAFQLDDGGTYKASSAQRKLWREWRRFIAQTQALKESLNAYVIVLFNGDVTDGDHHDTSQIITRNRSTMIRLAATVLEPLVSLSDMAVFVRGTPGHVGKGGDMEEAIAYDLGGWEHDGTHSHWKWVADVGGVVIDAAHHASMGRLPWTAKNAANKIAAKTLFDYASNHDHVPDVVLRSHNHRWADSYDNYPVRALCLPGWQLKTEYVHRLDTTSIPSIGGAFIVIDGGEYDIRKFNVKIDRPRPIKIRP